MRRKNDIPRYTPLDLVARSVHPSDLIIASILRTIANSDPKVPTVDQIARQLRLSQSRVRHIFKKEVGMPLGKYLKIRRLAAAKQVLETSNFAVKEAMSFVGINDISHFGRDYKVLFGETPAQTRRKGRGELRNVS